MSAEIKKLSLYCGQLKIKGSGDKLTMQIVGSRTNKLGTWEQHEITFELDRYDIQQIARQIATMHARDKQRLEGELLRIQHEQEAITQPEVEKK